MDTFFTLLKKSLVATVFVIFAFVATYIPQPYNNVSLAEAALSTTAGQALVVAQLVALNISNTAIAGADASTAVSTGYTWGKENILDTLGWVAAKQAVSMMVAELIDWINRGFEGKPAFVQDIGKFLLATADQVVGEYIQELNALGSFICSPFRLNVSISVELQHRRGTQPAPTCTLSGIIDNIDGFINGSFEEGGWKGWFALTATPQTNTPYGAALSAQAGARAAIINAKNEEITLLDFGAGFLSSKLCKDVDGPVGANGVTTAKQDCAIVMPGQTISDALSFNLDSGRQSLIAADEIDEILTSLLQTLANKAITGAAGLLGLSGGGGGGGSSSPGYTPSYLDRLLDASDSNFSYEEAGLLMEGTLDVQLVYLKLAVDAQNNFQAYLSNPLNIEPVKRASHGTAMDEAEAIITKLVGSFPMPNVASPSSVIGKLNDVIARYEDPAATDATRLDIAREFTDFVLYTEIDIRNTARSWEQLEANTGADQEIAAAIDNFDYTKMKELMDGALDTQIGIFNLAIEMENRSQRIISATTTDVATKATFQDASDKARALIIATKGSFPPPRVEAPGSHVRDMNDLISEWGNRRTTDADRLNIAQEFKALNLYSQRNLNDAVRDWAETLNKL